MSHALKTEHLPSRQIPPAIPSNETAAQAQTDQTDFLVGYWYFYDQSEEVKRAIRSGKAAIDILMMFRAFQINFDKFKEGIETAMLDEDLALVKVG